ncbi:hypothetical protein ACI8AV_13690 [Geodermatophilus sp. SYSU D00804]
MFAAAVTLDAEPMAASTEPDTTVPDRVEKKSAATMLVEIAAELYEFGISTEGHTFGDPRSGPPVIRLLRGGKTSLRGQLARAYFERTGRAAPQQALADALLVIEGTAEDGEPQRLHLRAAQRGGALWLDLGDATGRVVRITADGWTVAPQAPVLFRRSELNAALPEPVVGGALDELWNWLNVDPADRPLVAAWLVAILWPDMPHPVLSIFGEQGTGKSSATKLLVSVLDPSPVPLRKPPRDADSWVTAATGSLVVGLDNLSDIPAWLSDSMCRAVTGDGDVRRRLYTDGDFAVFAFRRCLLLNGIDIGAIRGDLAERMLPIHLQTISEQGRRTEEELWSAWDQMHPRLLGAVLDLAAGVAGVLPSVRLESKPRMADFARILAAVDRVLGTNGLDRYLGKQGAVAVDTLTGDPFITAIERMYAGNSFTGTAVELLTRLAFMADTRAKGWPGDARTVTQVLRRQAPTMRRAGWTVHDDEGKNHDKVIRWTITPPERPEMTGDPGPQPPHHPAVASMGAGNAGAAGAGYTASRDGGQLPIAAVPTVSSTDCGHPLTAAGKCVTCIVAKHNLRAGTVSGEPAAEAS